MITRAPPDGAMVFREHPSTCGHPRVTGPPVHVTLVTTTTVPAGRRRMPPVTFVFNARATA
jgi:hypothetical protein